LTDTESRKRGKSTVRKQRLLYALPLLPLRTARVLCVCVCASCRSTYVCMVESFKERHGFVIIIIIIVIENWSEWRERGERM
jgi:hypothetical protein